MPLDPCPPYHAAARRMMLGLLVALACQCGAVARAADQWRVEAKPGDIVTLHDEDGTTRIDFDVDVRDRYQLGHLNFKQATVRLYLAQPVALSPEQTRVWFEARGFKKIRDREASLQMLPLIRDASGEILLYEPFPWPHLRNATGNWCKWTTRYFYGAEAGAATQNIFQPELHPQAGDGNGWPDGALTFLGFEIQMRPPEFGRTKGTLWLGTVGFGGERLPAESPYGYADAFLKTKGDYRLAAAIRSAFQQLPVREFEQSIHYDPASAASRLQRLTFPLGGAGDYWIDYQITDAAGAVVATDSLRDEVVGNPQGPTPAPVDPRTSPSLGYLRINPDSRSQGVYDQLPMTVVVRAFPKGATELGLTWKLVAYPEYKQGAKPADQVIEQGEQRVTFAGANYVDVPLTLQGEARRDAYRLLLTVTRGEQMVDTRTYVVGRRTDLTEPYATRTGFLRGRDYVKQSPYFRTTYRPDSAASEDDYIKQFTEYLDQATQMARYVTFMLDLNDFEVLPGVYDFSTLDRVMDAAADRGSAITVRLAHADAHGLYRWLPYTQQVSYDGTVIYNHFYGDFNPLDPGYLAAWEKANHALFDRYRNHPAFQGYYLMEAGGESTVLDKPWLGIVAGYSTVMRGAFRDYLRSELGLSLAALNQRWGTHLTSWDAVEPPQPDFRAGTQPDLRRSWLDFCRFKVYANNRCWFQPLATDIRRYDSQHVIIAYNVHDMDGLIGKIDYTHGGGVMSMPGNGENIALWEKDHIGNCQEPFFPTRWNDGDEPYMVDWCLYTEMSRAGAGGLNLHVYYYPPSGSHGPLPDGYGADWGYDRYEHFKPIYRELHDARMVTNLAKDIAVYQDPTTLFTKHRTTFPYRLSDLARWFELLGEQGVAYENLRPERLTEYKLVLPNPLDEVISQESLDLLDRYVRQGGKLVLTALTGRYCPETGPAPFALLRRLGIEPPTGPYVETGTDVTARVTSANPLFEADRTIKFYTLANLRHDPDTAAVQARFFLWPYRWIPQTDYFGYYRDNKQTNGDVWARFADGGVAVSHHKVGQGDVVMFWGIPDYEPTNLPDLMKRAAAWAGAGAATSDNPLPLMLECQKTNGRGTVTRHYAVVWDGVPGFAVQPGTFRQKILHVPDGTWFVDDMVSGRRYGWYTGQELRTTGINLIFPPDNSALQVVRLIRGDPHHWPQWGKLYRQLPGS